MEKVNGLWDGACTVCGSHIYGGLKNGKRDKWSCGTCGATEDNPVFDENRLIKWSVMCYEANDCEHYKTEKCFNCEHCQEIDTPSITVDCIATNEKYTLDEDELKEWLCGLKMTYADTRHETAKTVKISYLSYTCATTIYFDGEKWKIDFNYD